MCSLTPIQESISFLSKGVYTQLSTDKGSSTCGGFLVSMTSLSKAALKAVLTTLTLATTGVFSSAKKAVPVTQLATGGNVLAPSFTAAAIWFLLRFRVK